MKRILWLVPLLPALSFGQDACDEPQAVDDWCKGMVYDGTDRVQAETQKTIRDPSTAEHNKLATEKAVADYVAANGGGIIRVVVKLDGDEPEYDGSVSLYPEGSTVDITNQPDNTHIYLASDADGTLIVDGLTYAVKVNKTTVIRKFGGVFTEIGKEALEPTILTGTTDNDADTSVAFVGTPQTYGWTAYIQSATAWVGPSPTTFTIEYQFGTDNFELTAIDAALQDRPYIITVDNN